MKNTKIGIALPYIYIIGGIIGCFAAFALTYDKIQILKNPTYQPSCNINPILSCGSVMEKEQSSLFGIPNPIFGLMGFSSLAVIGIVLIGSATFKRWLWRAINAGAFLGFAFLLYLFFQSVYRLNNICPYCFIVWMVIPPIFWYTTIYNLQQGYIKLSNRPKQFIMRHHGDIIILWYVLIFGLLAEHFWYYWKTLI